MFCFVLSDQTSLKKNDWHGVDSRGVARKMCPLGFYYFHRSTRIRWSEFKFDSVSKNVFTPGQSTVYHLNGWSNESRLIIRGTREMFSHTIRCTRVRLVFSEFRFYSVLFFGTFQCSFSLLLSVSCISSLTLSAIDILSMCVCVCVCVSFCFFPFIHFANALDFMYSAVAWMVLLGASGYMVLHIALLLLYIGMNNTYVMSARAFVFVPMYCECVHAKWMKY